ncbi:MAG TPA: hypothetical protein VEC12_04985 [Bacteroidia bacterium]|nr:hypothetical protein [Bacteroidia bacterium]
MKKTVILFLLAICFSVRGVSQGFMQVSFGTDVYSGDDYEGRQSASKTIDLQIGRFADEELAESFTLGFSTGLKYRDDLGTLRLPSGPEIKAERLYSFNILSLGYERKIIWFGEFDDLWNVYTTRRLGLILVQSKMEYNEPVIAALHSNDQYSKTGIGFNVGASLGAARKFNKSTYAFSDLTLALNYGGELLNMPVTLSLGVRRLF